MKKPTLILALSFLFPNFHLGQERRLENVAYDDKDPAQILDAYLADKESPVPAMIFFHGGGWRAGSKKAVPAYLLAAVQEGWLSVISVEYRFTDVAPHPAQVEDCGRAIQFVRSRAKEWNINPDRIGAMGSSAGGHLSLWLALHDDLALPDSPDAVARETTRLQCAISLAGPTDWSLLQKIDHQHPAYRQLIGYAPKTPYEEMDSERLSKVSPISFVSSDDPPVLLVHGSADEIVPIEHARALDRALKKAKVPSQLRVIEGAGHAVPREREDVRLITSYIQRQLIPRSRPSGKTTIPREIQDSLETHKDITYARYGDRELQLDLYRPKSAKGTALPGIVCIHGGGWSKGTRASHANLAMALATRGFAAATISYRLSGEAMFPAAIHDCKAAVRWMRANAEEHGILSDQIGATGLSAGGHLTALLATSAEVAELEGKGGHAGFSSRIQVAAAFGAQTDAMSERIRELSKTSPLWRNFLGGSQEESSDTYRLASPLSHLDSKDPPVLLMAGEFDNLGTRGVPFRKRMNELGLDTEYIELSGGPHGFLTGQNWFDICVNETARFFKKHLGE